MIISIFQSVSQINPILVNIQQMGYLQRCFIIAVIIQLYFDVFFLSLTYDVAPGLQPATPREEWEYN